MNDINDARQQKYREGMKEHRNGSSEYVGEHPVLELHDEGLDAMNYVEELARNGDLSERMAYELRLQAHGLVLGARAAARQLGMIP